jgi:hypothetical protein
MFSLDCQDPQDDVILILGDHIVLQQIAECLQKTQCVSVERVQREALETFLGVQWQLDISESNK